MKEGSGGEGGERGRGRGEKGEDGQNFDRNRRPPKLRTTSGCIDSKFRLCDFNCALDTITEKRHARSKPKRTCDYCARQSCNQ